MGKSGKDDIIMTNTIRLTYSKLFFSKSTIVLALIISLIVGTILNLINQGELLIKGEFSNLNFLKFVLTFFVPYLVSSFSSVISKITFKTGEFAPFDAEIYCKKCHQKLFITKGQLVPRCNCQKGTRWKPKILYKSKTEIKNPDYYSEFEMFHLQQIQSLAFFGYYNPASVFRTDSNGFITETNIAANRIFKKESIINLSLFDIFPKLDVALLNNLITEDKPYYFIESIDNKYYKFDIKGIASINSCQIYGSDITEIENVKIENQKLKLAVEQTDSSILITDVNGIIEYANKACEKISGYSRSEMYGKNPNLFSSGLNPKELYTKLWNNLKKGESWQGEFLNRKKDGTIYWEKAFITAIWDNTDQLTNYIAIKEDISEIKNAEEKLKSMALFAELNPEPVFRIDENGIILQSNSAANHAFGLESLVKQYAGSLIPSLKDTNLKQLIVENKLLTFTHTINENIYRFILRGISDFNVCQIYGSDITERVRAAEEIKQQKENIEQQNAEITAQRDEIEKQNELLSQRNTFILHQNKKITDSINYASLIQQGMFSHESALRNAFKDYFIFFKPKDIVSGDFYWFYEQSDEIWFSVADCTGHGVPGAFMSILGMSYLNEILASHRIENTSQLLNHLRKKIITTFSKNTQERENLDGMDIAMCQLNLATMKLNFSGANNPCILVRKQQLIELKPDKMPIGKHIKENIEFTFERFDIQSNDAVYLYSDGFQDQFGDISGKKFMSKNFKELLRSISHLPMNNQKTIIEKTLNDWKGAKEQVDDILILGIRF